MLAKFKTMLLMTGLSVGIAVPALRAADAPVTGGKTAQPSVDAVVVSYLAAQRLLADDKVDGVSAELAKIKDVAAALGKGDVDEKVKQQAIAIAKASMGEAKDLKQARDTFKVVSGAVIALVGAVAPSDAATPALYEASCPMAKAHWLQTTKEVSNPYMGKEMLTCGEVERTIKGAAGK